MKPIHLLLPLLLAACGSDNSGASADGAAMAEVDMIAPPEAASAAQGAAVTSRAAPKTASTAAAADSAPASVAPAMLIRTGRASVEVDSIEPAVATAQRLVQQLGGYVGNTSISSGEQEARTATLELKIPAARFEQAVGGLKPIGRVDSVQVSAEDVGEEFVDVSARVANARRMEQRLIELLATRTGKLEDALTVERELARVRGEIESAEGRLRYLRSRASISTLVVTLHEPRPVVGDYPSQNPIVEAFRDSWRNFIGFIAWFISALGFLIPFGLLLLAGWWVWRRISRMLPERPRRFTPPPAPASPPTPPSAPPAE